MTRITNGSVAEERPPQRAAQRRSEPAGAWPLRVTDEEGAALRAALGVLTPRELEVVLAICEGGSNESIADRLCVALPTLRTHLMRIHQKIGSRGKSDIVRVAANVLLEAYRSGDLKSHAAREEIAASPAGV